MAKATQAAAPKTTMAAEQSQDNEEQRAARMAARTYVASEQDWDSTEGMEYGGQADILEMEIGEVGGPFTYIGSQPLALEKGSTTVHIGTDPHGNNIRLPISASFVRAADQARLNPGDTFLVRRGDDVKKLRGIGKGQDMKIFSIKVKTRQTPAN